MNSGGGVAES